LLTWAIVINYSMLVGTMIFFVSVVSPSAISTLQVDYLASFLRAIFPKMYLMGLLIGIIGSGLIFYIKQPLVLLSSGLINLSFLINLLIITPKINSIRDRESLDENIREKRFEIYHGFSILLFLSNFVLSGFIILNQVSLKFSIF
jgi:hypothetical protein